MIKANAMTATNNNLVIVLTSMSNSPTLDRGAELFITDLVSGPTVNNDHLHN